MNEYRHFISLAYSTHVQVNPVVPSFQPAGLSLRQYGGLSGDLLSSSSKIINGRYVPFNDPCLSYLASQPCFASRAVPDLVSPRNHSTCPSPRTPGLRSLTGTRSSRKNEGPSR